MKVLIIGAKGMLGQELVREFSPGHDVIAWDREEINIADPSCKSKILNSKFDILINAAAYNNVDGAETDTETANLVNGYAVGNLAKICSELEIPIVHYSTDYVFDGENKDGYVESDKPNPISAYGRSKLLGEQELASNTDKYYLIRLSKLFGEAAQSGGGKKSFVEVMLSLSETKSELEVVDEEFSCPTYASDLARQTRNIAEQKLPYGIYHGANSGAATWYELAKEIFRIKNKNINVKPVSGSHFPRPAKRPMYTVLLNTKLPSARSWQEALAEFLAK